MSNTRVKIHPGSRMFGNAMAGIRGSTNHRKRKPINLKDDIQSSELTHAESSRQTKIAEVVVPVCHESTFDSLQDETHFPSDIDDNYQENTIADEPSDEDDYSLPLMHSVPPPGFNMSLANHLNPHYYPTLHSFSYAENSTYYSHGAFTPTMAPWESFNPSVQCSNLEQKPSDVYAFRLSTLPIDSSGPDDSCQLPTEPLNVSIDYSLPLTLRSQDSGCLSSEDGNSSETSLKDSSLPFSPSYYHMVNSSESPSSAQQALNGSSPEDSASQPKANPGTELSGRVSRRSISRVQGSSTRLSIGNKPAKNIPIPRKNLPVSTPQYVTMDISDDSGVEVSPDDDTSPLRSSYAGGTGCEQESELLYKADSQKRWRPLPDYSRLTFKSDPGFIDSHCHLDFLLQRQNYDGIYTDYMFKHRDTYHAACEGCDAERGNPHTFHKVCHESTFDPLQDETHFPSDIDDNYQENTIADEPSDEDDYSLPLMQSVPGFNMFPANHPNPHYYPTLHSFSYAENSTYYSPGSLNHTENSMYYSPGAFTPTMALWESFNPSVQCSNLEPKPSDVYAFRLSTLEPKPSDVYAFRLSTLPIDSSGPDDSCQLPTEPLNVSIDYSLPLTLRSQDSGCLSSEDGNSSETSLKDSSLPFSPSYYHMVNSSESPSSAQQALNGSSPEDSASQPKANPGTELSGRVSRRSISRVQGSSTRLSIGNKPAKNIPIPRKNLPVSTPQYVTMDISDDSGVEVSPDDDTSPLRSSYAGCTGCEQESELLYKADSQKRWRPLPDCSRLNFLTFKSDPGFIDSHCHLDFLLQRQNYDGTYTDYMFKHRDTYPAAYEGCVAVFCNPRTFHKKTMWQRYLNENGVWGAFGCHPHNANAYSDLIESDLCAALLHSKVRALGEIGLDYSNRNDCSKERQHIVFRRQLKIALNNKLPLVIHCRDANEDIMNIMKEILPKNYTIHLHCFTDSWDWAQRWLKQFPNLFIGITNLVTYNSAEPTHEVAKKIPLDRLLLETDAPYFIPRRSPRTTKFSHPGMAIHVAAQIATLRGVPLKEIIHRTRQNTKKMYGI